MNKLIHAEANRMVTVINESIDSAHRLAALSKLLAHSENEYQNGEGLSESKLEGDETSINNTNFMFPERCRTLNTAVQAYRKAEYFFNTVNNKAAGQKRTDELERSADLVQETTRSVCRAFRMDPTAVDYLFDVVQRKESKWNEDDSTHSMHEFGDLLVELRKLLLESISTTVEQEHAKQEFNRELKARTRQASDDLETLRAAFQEQVSERGSETDYYNEIVNKLEKELGEIKNTNDIETQTLVMETKQWEEQSIKSHDQSKTAALETLAKLKENYDSTIVEHGDAEESLRKKVAKVQTEVTNLVHKYDEALGERMTELRILELRYEQEQKRLAELAEHYRKVDRDLANEAAELAIIAAEQAKIDAAQKELDDAAAKIQAIFRGNKQRKTKKKGGKKQGKGKKSKKKKK